MFGNDFRIENLIFKPRNESLLFDPNFSIISKDYLEEVYYFQTAIEKSSVKVIDKDYKVKDLCWTAFLNGDCVTQSPMNYWQGNLERLTKDDDIQQTLNCFKTVDPEQTITCMDGNKIPVQEKAVFGGITRTVVKSCVGNKNNVLTNGLDVSEKDSPFKKNFLNIFSKEKDSTSSVREDDDPCNESTIAAKIFLVTYLLQNDQLLAPVSELFEQEIFEKIIQKFNDATDTSIFKEFIPDIEVKPLNLKINYMLEISINHELKAESKANAFIVLVSYSLMFIYIACSMGNICSFVGSNILLSFFGILFIMGSVFMSYCVCGYLQIKASLISLEVIPFLILAIGVDNMFLIYHSVSQVPSSSTATKIGVGLRSASSSITVASFTQILTFAVGLYIDIPALKTFCLTAIFALFFNYVFQMTAIPALLAIDLKRRSLGYCDLLPFCPVGKPQDISKTERSLISKFFKSCWKPLILSIPCKIISFAVMLSLFGLFFFALYDLPLGLDQQLPVLKDGNMYNYFGDIKKYIEIGPIGSLIIENADYSDDGKTINVINGLVELISQKDNLIVQPWRIWYQGVISLRDMSTAFPQIKNACFKGVDPEDYVHDFAKLTEYYLKIDLKNECCSSYGLCGGQFYEDIEFKAVY